MSAPVPLAVPPARRAGKVLAGLLLALVMIGGLVALGVWQIERRAWKLALIDRVEARVHAVPGDPPPRDRWPSINAAEDEYRHLRVEGVWVDQAQTLVQAVTDFGGGFWVVTPLRLVDGTLVLVNRGFVASDQRDRILPGAPNRPTESGQDGAAAPVTVTGLLRLTEPAGGFLRNNEPTTDRWFSRDVEAIANARGLGRLGPVAPYFIDADAAPRGATSATSATSATGATGATSKTAASAAGATPAAGTSSPSAASTGPSNPSATSVGQAPIGGLTVIAFHNNHLVYAVTWFTLALMVAGATWRVLREETSRRVPPNGTGIGT